MKGGFAALKQNGNSAKFVKKKKKKKMSKAGMIIVSIISTLALTAFVVCSYVLISALIFINGDIAVDLDEYKESQNQTSFIYATDSNGKTVELARLHGEEDRVWVDLEDMSPYMSKAVIALEDNRFETHSGVDWIRLGGVILKPDQIGQGGSTLTQQLIKNLTNNKSVTIVRKYWEILSALNFEKHYDKDIIIEAYLNTAYFGSGCYGVKTAAQKYFGKDIKELNAVECAVIASITQKPTTNNPLLNPEKNRERAEYCLKVMNKLGSISNSEYQDALNYKLIFTNSEDYVPDENSEAIKKVNENSVINSFYVDYVIQCVRDDLMEEYGYSKQQATDEIYYHGLKIYAAVDLDIQNTLEDIYVNRKSLPTTTHTYKNNNGEEVKEKVQSAMTIMDYSGRVVAIVGQADEKTENRGLNRAANSYRQPGSTIKPLATYAPAIEMNIHNYSSKVKDYAIALNGEFWPHNVDKSLGSGSNVTVQYAVQESLNTVPARIIKDDLGIENSFNFLQNKFHLSNLDDTNDKSLAPLATGALTHGATTVEMASAYATFGNGGIYYKPYSYYKVTNSKGTKTVLSNEEPKCERAISEETSFIMNKILQTVNTSYYGTASTVRKFPIFAKTGTTTSEKDRWFCAGTPYYVAAVWCGYDHPDSLNYDLNPCGKIFFRVFDEIHEGLAQKEFPTSTGVVEKRYCTVSGKLAGSKCYSTRTGYYKLTNLPPVCTSCTGGHSGTSSTNPANTGEIVDQVISGIGEIVDKVITDNTGGTPVSGGTGER